MRSALNALHGANADSDLERAVIEARSAVVPLPVEDSEAAPSVAWSVAHSAEALISVPASPSEACFADESCSVPELRPEARSAVVACSVVVLWPWEGLESGPQFDVAPQFESHLGFERVPDVALQSVLCCELEPWFDFAPRFAKPAVAELRSDAELQSEPRCGGEPLFDVVRLFAWQRASGPQFDVALRPWLRPRGAGPDAATQHGARPSGVVEQVVVEARSVERLVDEAQP
ncbi:MAG TPA: hypothetical protein VKV95_23170 [Terriglobia bacterium]|nr:hypothetical protein [Terriglobia bacterium]